MGLLPIQWMVKFGIHFYWNMQIAGSMILTGMETDSFYQAVIQMTGHPMRLV